MGETRNYDELLDQSPLRFVAKGETYEFSPEAPIGRALEWIDYNTNPDRLASEKDGSTRMETNYRLLFGDETYEQFVERNVGSKTLNEFYLDLLEDWDLFVDPARARRKAGIRPVAEIVAELREALLASPEADVAVAAAEMVEAIEQTLANVGSESQGE